MVDISARQVGDGLFTTRVLVRNVVYVEGDLCRDEALMHSLVSAHLVLGVQRGEFVSLLEPPAELQELAAQCQNVGVWPVLVGEQGQRDSLLASPIILYDYPQIAPESAGDLFDGTEIDEILSLRIMTLTDEEKNEIRQSDDRARQILERTDAMPAEQFMKLHGAMRGMRPLKEDNP
jgi:hydrogenase maturation protease